MYLSSAIGVPTMPPATPFEDFDPYKSLHGPCISIPITDAVRRLDAEKNKLVGPSDWEKFKLTLSEDNLRMARVRPVGPGQIQENLHHVLPPSGKRWHSWAKTCECGEKMGYAAKQCLGCYKAARKLAAEMREA